MRTTTWILLVLAVTPALALAQEECSLVVRVVSESGLRPSGVSVKLEESGGRFQAAVTDSHGEARFCGLGIRGVTVTVGGQCNQVVVSNIPLTWGQTRTVSVFYDRGPCLVDSPTAPGCSVLLRFSDERGNLIPEVHFDPPLDRPARERTDAYGRAMVHLKPSEELHINATSPGYNPERVGLTCPINSTRELMITLRKQR
jgi:hypothetical protein